MRQLEHEGEVNHDVALMRANAAYQLRKIDRSNIVERKQQQPAQRIDVLYVDMVFPSGVWHWPDEGEGAL